MQFQWWMDTIKAAWRIYSGPPAIIDVWGGSQARDFFNNCVSRHRKLPLVRNKTIGAALIDLSDEDIVQLSGSRFAYMRRMRRKAVTKHFTVRAFHAADYLEHILEINASTPVRQGRGVDASYLDRDAVAIMAERETLSFGAFDADGVLRAYAHTPILGDVFVFLRIMGHARYNQFGIMYLLVSETNRAMAQTMKASGAPRWALYDMYLGSQGGLRFFKTHCGFDPRRAIWRWKERASNEHG
jgi:hypothetical protein